MPAVSGGQFPGCSEVPIFNNSAKQKKCPCLRDAEPELREGEELGPSHSDRTWSRPGLETGSRRLPESRALPWHPAASPDRNRPPIWVPQLQQNYFQQWYDFTTRETGSSNKVMHSKALKRGSSHKETIWGEICKAQRTGCDLCIIVGLKLHCKLTTLEPSGCPHPQAYAKQGCLRWEL